MAAVIVETPEGVILSHNVAWPQGMYSIITGFVDPLELPIDTAMREVQEELGLKAYDVKYVGQYMFKAKNQLIIAYSAKARGTIKLNHELDDYKIVPVEKLRGWPGATGEAVSDWVASISGSRKTSLS